MAKPHSMLHGHKHSTQFVSAYTGYGTMEVPVKPYPLLLILQFSWYMEQCVEGQKSLSLSLHTEFFFQILGYGTVCIQFFQLLAIAAGILLQITLAFMANQSFHVTWAQSWYTNYVWLHMKRIQILGYGTMQIPVKPC